MTCEKRGSRVETVDEERRPSAAAAIDDGVGAIRERTDDAAKSILRNQLETPVVREQVKRGLRRADLDRTVVEDLLQLGLKLLNLGMHARSLNRAAEKSVSYWWTSSWWIVDSSRSGVAQTLLSVPVRLGRIEAIDSGVFRPCLKNFGHCPLRKHRQECLCHITAALFSLRIRACRCM